MKVLTIGLFFFYSAAICAGETISFCPLVCLHKENYRSDKPLAVWQAAG
jgi:hypothetical protein